MEVDEQNTIYRKYRNRIDECSGADVKKLKEIMSEVYKLDQSVIENRSKNALIDILDTRIRRAKINSIPSLSNKELLKWCRNESGEIQRAAYREAELRKLGTRMRHPIWTIVGTLIIMILAGLVVKYWDNIIRCVSQFIDFIK